MKKIVYTAVLIVSIIVIGVVWFRLWLYQGFIAPLPSLTLFIESSGEGYYNLVWLEIYVNLIVIYFGTWAIRKSSMFKKQA